VGSTVRAWVLCSRFRPKYLPGRHVAPSGGYGSSAGQASCVPAGPHEHEVRVGRGAERPPLPASSASRVPTRVLHSRRGLASSKPNRSRGYSARAARGLPPISGADEAISSPFEAWRTPRQLPARAEYPNANVDPRKSGGVAGVGRPGGREQSTHPTTPKRGSGSGREQSTHPRTIAPTSGSALPRGARAKYPDRRGKQAASGVPVGALDLPERRCRLTSEEGCPGPATRRRGGSGRQSGAERLSAPPARRE